MTRPPTTWTPALAIRTTVYLCAVAMLLMLSPDLRNSVSYLLSHAAVVAAGAAGVLLGLLALTASMPRR